MHNLEATKGAAVIAHGGSQRVRLVPVPAEERAPVLEEYVRVASSGRKHFPLPVGAPLSELAAIAAQYQVYRTEAPTGGCRTGKEVVMKRLIATLTIGILVLSFVAAGRLCRLRG